MCGCLDSTNAVSSSVGYRHDNPALTEKRVAQILSEARAAMKAMEAPQPKVFNVSSFLTLLAYYGVYETV